MALYQRAYLYKQGGEVSSVVTNKDLIKGAKEEDFEEVTLMLSDTDLDEWNSIKAMSDEADLDELGGNTTWEE